MPFPTWVIDLDANADFEVVPRTGGGPSELSPTVIRAGTASAQLRLTRSGLPVDARRAFSGLWTRSLEALPRRSCAPRRGHA